MKFSRLNECFQTITDDDVLEAMKKIPGYLDITPSDFLQIYQIAFDHAVSRIKTAIKADQIMTRQVITVGPDAPLIEVAARMGENKISGLPVVDNDQVVVGVISEKDFLKGMNHLKNPSFIGVLLQCLDSSGGVAASLKSLSAADIMSSPPVTVTVTASILDVANTMDRLNINRVPVVDENANLAGIIARSDLVQAMC
jgi:CBS domain-containing protein